MNTVKIVTKSSLRLIDRVAINRAEGPIWQGKRTNENRPLFIKKQSVALLSIVPCATPTEK